MTPNVFSSDSDALTQILDNLSAQLGLDKALDTLLPQLDGSYSLIISDGSRLIGVRDPNGIRPLCIARINDLSKPGYVLASENSAFTSSVEYLKNIEPGEIIQIDKSGLESRLINAERSLKICAFEYVYFARPDSDIEGRNVYSSRENAERILAKEHPVEADIVIGLPDTGMHSAYGYSEVSKIPVKPGVTKNPYTGRTFINPDDISREDAIRLKLRPISSVLSGQRVVVCDDSIVRGNTMRIMVSNLRSAGATDIHLRIASPPYRWPCFYGMDNGNRDELFAYKHSKEEMRKFLGADSLEFISNDGLIEAIGLPIGSLCLACTTGQYPTKLPERITSVLLSQKQHN
ncbi:amidophosphoribosyltransferase [Candidatus Saccharibacteria bacterium]|nr:amidophosphoribosyltransferase [Candidatus Saccharibacteria bacterium]